MKITKLGAMKKKKAILIFFILLFSFTSFAQDNGVGVRVISLPNLTGVGATFKHMIAGKMSYEASVGTDLHTDFAFIKSDFNFVQRPVGIQGLDWYVGAGAQSWFSSSSFDIAPELTLGLDWDLVSLPFGFFLDGSFYVPLVDHSPVQAQWQFGAGVRYLFK